MFFIVIAIYYKSYFYLFKLCDRKFLLPIYLSPIDRFHPINFPITILLLINCTLNTFMFIYKMSIRQNVLMHAFSKFVQNYNIFQQKFGIPIYTVYNILNEWSSIFTENKYKQTINIIEYIYTYWLKMHDTFLFDKGWLLLCENIVKFLLKSPI